MIEKAVKILLIFIIALFQIILMPLIEINGVWPNIVLLTAIALIFLGKKDDVFWLALLGGFILDLSNPLKFSFNIVILPVILLLINYVFERFLSESNIFIIGLVSGFSGLIYGLFFLVISGNWFYNGLVADFFYSAFAGIAAYVLMKKIIKERTIIGWI